MPLKNGRVTRSEQKYIDLRAQGVAPLEAAKQAEYRNPHNAVARLEDSAIIIKQIRARQALWLHDSAYGLAQSVVIDILSDDKAKQSDRLRAAELIFKEGRALAELDAASTDSGTDTLAEIQAKIKEFERLRQLAEQELTDITPKADVFT